MEDDIPNFATTKRDANPAGGQDITFIMKKNVAFHNIDASGDVNISGDINIGGSFGLG